jgi:signal transduction histidine kinase
MPASRLSLKLVLPTGLILLVVILGAFQYRWLGQVSEAERAQLQRSLNQRAQQFADEFDLEIGFVYARLGISQAALDSDPWAALNEHYGAWKSKAPHADLIKAVYLSRQGLSRSERTLEQLTLGAATGQAVNWPLHLEPVRRLIDRAPLRPSEPPSTLQILALTRAGVVDSVPALIIPVAQPPQRVGAAGDIMVAFQTPSTAAVIVELDRSVLTSRVLPELVERHFPDKDASQYHIAVRGSDQNALFVRGITDPNDVTAGNADAMAGFFSTPHLETAARTFAEGQLMSWQFSSATMSRSATITAGTVAPGSTVSTRVATPTAGMSLFVQERTGVPKASSQIVMTTLGGWHIALRHGAGSLDAAVAQARRRNLMISFSILSVLAFGVGLIVVNARRSEKLAAQQMDFVATVSHELRTPLAVIRSAAQNLAAGVVDDPVKAKRYGDLIETEGRRLTDMVEEVLEFAGLSGQRRALALRHVDAVALVQEVVQSSGALITAAHVEAEVTAAEDVPLILGDEEALRRAVSNLLTNALKHGGEGRWVGLSVSGRSVDGHDEVHIAVSDRGRGIDPGDLPHIFEPFYRGRYALNQQIQGNGLGLCLVQRIVEAHGGRVSVTSTSDQGTTITLHLPVAPDVAA